MYAINEIRAALPVDLSPTPHSHWLVKNRECSAAVDAVNSHLSGGTGSYAVEQLKVAVNRDIFRCTLTERPLRFVAKTFPMGSIKQQISSYKRYGPTEARNLIEARKRNLPVPELYGFGWQQRGFRIKRTMVLIEDLQGFSPLTTIQNVTDEMAQLAILRPVADALLNLYAAGCNHIDLSVSNIFVNDRNPANIRLIDFMYVVYLPAGSTNVLAFHAAYLSDSLRQYGVAEKTCREWAKELFSRGVIAAAPGELISKYDSFRGRRLSRKQRLALT